MSMSDLTFIEVQVCMCVFVVGGVLGVAVEDSGAHLALRQGGGRCGWGPKVQPVASPLPVPASTRELPVCRTLIYTLKCQRKAMWKL